MLNLHSWAPEWLKKRENRFAICLSAVSLYIGSAFFSPDPPRSGDPVYTILDHIEVYSEDTEDPQDKPITVLDSDGNKIESNVYRLSLALVNRGNAGLKGLDFADEIKIKPNKATILHTDISAENDRDNTAFELATLTNDDDTFEVVEVLFNQWLPTKGVTLEIWYSSMDSQGFQVTGSDMDGIVLTEVAVAASTSKAQTVLSIMIMILSTILLSAGVVVVIHLTFGQKNSYVDFISERSNKVLIAIGIVSFSLLITDVTLNRLKEDNVSILPPLPLPTIPQSLIP